MRLTTVDAPDVLGDHLAVGAALLQHRQLPGAQGGHTNNTFYHKKCFFALTVFPAFVSPSTLIFTLK